MSHGQHDAAGRAPTPGPEAALRFQLDQSCSVGDALHRAERERRPANDADILPASLVLDLHAANRTAARIVELLAMKFAIRVMLVRLTDDRTGVLNGTVIRLEQRLPPATRLFFLLHLAGHTFQFISADRSSVVRYFSRSTLPYEDRIRERKRYEQEATAYGLSMLAEIGAPVPVQTWFRRVSALDFQYGKRYIEDKATGLTLRKSEAYVEDWWEMLPPKVPPPLRTECVEEYWSS